jgi:hypothetical protein
LDLFQIARAVGLADGCEQRIDWMVGPEPRAFAFDEMKRLIERNPEFEKLFVARGLRHPQPEVLPRRFEILRAVQNWRLHANDRVGCPCYAGLD